MWIHAKAMTALDLSFCALLTDSCLMTLAGSGNARSLRSIRLHGLGHLTDLGVVRLAHAAPMLESIGLDGCEEVSSVALQALAQGCPRLQSIKLSSCTAVDDSGVAALAAGCPRLTRLDLTQIQNVSDESLVALGAAGLAEFAWIGLSHCPQISDAGIAALTQGCPTLQSLGVAACIQLRAPALAQIATHCRGLTHLNLSWITGFTDQGIDVLAKGCSALVLLNIAKCMDVSSEHSQHALVSLRDHRRARSCLSCLSCLCACTSAERCFPLVSRHTLPRNGDPRHLSSAFDHGRGCAACGRWLEGPPSLRVRELLSRECEQSGTAADWMPSCHEHTTTGDDGTQDADVTLATLPPDLNPLWLSLCSHHRFRYSLRHE